MPIVITYMNSNKSKLKIKQPHKKNRCSEKDKERLDVKSRLSEFQEKSGENKSIIAFKPIDGDFTRALDKFVDGVYISDQKYSLLYTSPSLQEVFGPQGNKKCFNYLFNREDACPWCRNDEVFAGEVVSWEHDFDSHQKVFEILELPLYFSDKVMQKLTMYRDITERKRAEEALRESEKKHRKLLENLPQIIFHKDANLVYVSCNNHYAQDLGIEPNKIKGKTDFDFYPKELAEKYRADDRRLMESGQTEEIEETYIKNGQELFVQTVKTPLTDDSGNVTGILGIFWDITKRKQTEEQLRKTHVTLIEEQVKLKQKNLALNEILKQIDFEKNLIKSQTQSNIDRFILPILGDLENGANENQKKLIETLRESLIEITSPFINQLETRYSNLSPRETEICKLIKEEYSSKEIASLLSLSAQTIHLQRKHIRKKLGITNRNVNLTTHLRNI